MAVNGLPDQNICKIKCGVQISEVWGSEVQLHIIIHNVKVPSHHICIETHYQLCMIIIPVLLRCTNFIVKHKCSLR